MRKEITHTSHPISNNTYARTTNISTAVNKVQHVSTNSAALKVPSRLNFSNKPIVAACQITNEITASRENKDSHIHTLNSETLSTCACTENEKLNDNVDSNFIILTVTLNGIETK